MRWVHLALMGAAVGLACGCGGDDDGGGGGGGDGGGLDGGGGADGGSGGLAWESVEVLFDDGEVITERVTYRSDGLLVYGQVCRPKTGGPYPVMVYNHGGFSGLGVDPMSGNCVDSARNGFIWLGSSYRGEDGSEGQIEVCLGEVTDVLTMIEIGLAQPYSDPDRVAMWGGSHGGCITLRALQRGAPVQVAIDVFGPTDMAANYQFWREGVESGSEWAAVHQSLIDTLDTAVGGSPDEYPEEYQARSPLHFVEDLPEGVPLLVTQGTIDALVPPDQSCALGAAVGLESYHLDAAQAEVTTPPVGCEDSGITWQPGPRPTDWPGGAYLVVYDDLGHGFDGAAGEAMVGDILTFFFAHMP